MARNNRVLVPAARAGLDRFKVEIANELGISNYDEIDKGELTSRQNGCWWKWLEEWFGFYK